MSSATLLLLLGLVPPLIQAQGCLPSPVSIPIEDVLLTNNAYVHGASMTIGTPPRNISFFVNSNNNESYIYGDNGHCVKERSVDECTSFRGGRINESSSTLEILNKGFSERETSRGNAGWATDTFRINDNLTLTSFEFGIPRTNMNDRYFSQAIFGLGQNSSVLDSLKKTAHIGARAYSMFWGLVGGPKNSQSSGSLILGGYDSAIAGKSENYTANLAYKDCETGLLVTIDDIEINWPNGTDSSLFQGSRNEIMPACIKTSFAGLMTLPDRYWKPLLSLSGTQTRFNNSHDRSFDLNYFTMVLKPEPAFFGDLTISIQNGIKIRVPNSELVVNNPEYQPDGQIIANSTTKNIVVNALSDANENDFPILGRLFMSSAYLMVNYDADEFTLWQVDTKATPGDIKAVSPTGQIVDRFCSNTSQVIDVAPSGSSPPTPRTGSGSALSGGAIAGIVVGGVAAIAAIAAIAFIIFRRRRRAEKGFGAGAANGFDDKPPVYSEQHAAAGTPQFPVEIQGQETQAVPGSAVKPMELQASATPPLPQELDSTVVGR